MKKVFATVLAVFLFMTMFGTSIKAQGVQLPVLMYHSVDTTGGMYSVTPEKLEKDVTDLKRAGYTPVSLDEVIAFVHRGEELPDKPVVLTFDDGYENNYSTLLPMAERLDFKFEVFTVAGFVHYSPYAMEWDQVAKLNNSPYGAIGCHTYNLHSYTPDGREGVLRMKGENFREWEHIFRNDLCVAKSVFIDNTGYAPVAFAYPNGKFSAETDRILREEGYIVTITTEPGVNRVEQGNMESLYLMLRISMDANNSSPVDEIEKHRDISYTNAILKEKAAVWSSVNVSRKEALDSLFGEKFKSTRYNLSSIEGYSDLKHADAYTRALFARCVGNNIISGFPDWTMRPSHYITRGEFALLLARRTGYDGRSAIHKFTDSSWWNEGALSWCYEKGYMIGYGEEFGVNDFLTKEQINLVCTRAGL